MVGRIVPAQGTQVQSYDPVMGTDAALTRIAAAQMAAHVAGLAVALRRRRAYDILWVTGRQENVARDAVFMGTSYSAPLPMLVLQGVCIAALARGPNVKARRGLGLLGAVMVPGYLGERLVRRRLSRAGWDPLESPLVLVGVTLAGALAAVGLRR